MADKIIKCPTCGLTKTVGKFKAPGTCKVCKIDMVKVGDAEEKVVAKRTANVFTAASKFYEVELTFTDKMLASAPANPEIYSNYIESKKPESETEDESKNIPNKEDEHGLQVFHRENPDQPSPLFIRGYVVKAFTKVAISQLAQQGINKITNHQAKVIAGLFIKEKHIHLLSASGKALVKADGFEERACRAVTPMGPRTFLLKSEYVDVGTKVKFTIQVTNPQILTEDVLRSIFDYGEFSGLGQWRNSGKGQFTYQLKEIK